MVSPGNESPVGVKPPGGVVVSLDDEKSLNSVSSPGNGWSSATGTKPIGIPNHGSHAKSVSIEIPYMLIYSSLAL